MERSLAELAEHVGGTVEGDARQLIVGVSRRALAALASSSSASAFWKLT